MDFSSTPISSMFPFLSLFVYSLFFFLQIDYDVLSNLPDWSEDSGNLSETHFGGPGPSDVALLRLHPPTEVEPEVPHLGNIKLKLAVKEDNKIVVK